MTLPKGRFAAALASMLLLGATRAPAQGIEDVEKSIQAAKKSAQEQKSNGPQNRAQVESEALRKQAAEADASRSATGMVYLYVIENNRYDQNFGELRRIQDAFPAQVASFIRAAGLLRSCVDLSKDAHDLLLSKPLPESAEADLTRAACADGDKCISIKQVGTMPVKQLTLHVTYSEPGQNLGRGKDTPFSLAAEADLPRFSDRCLTGEDGSAAATTDGAKALLSKVGVDMKWADILWLSNSAKITNSRSEFEMFLGFNPGRNEMRIR